MTTTTTVPTEEGVYLFFGTYNTQPHGTSLPHQPELVRVGRNDQGLLYIGRDIYHNPHALVGAWMEIPDQIEAVTTLGTEAIKEWRLSQLVERFSKRREEAPTYWPLREHFLWFLSEGYRFSVPDEEQRKLKCEAMADAAFERGLLSEEPHE